MPKRILIIDDETQVLGAIEMILSTLGYEVRTESDGVCGERAAIENEYDLILTDLHMPVRNGAEITVAVRSARADARILVITGYPSDPLAQAALAAGAMGILRKPFEVARILAYLEEDGA